MKVFDLTFADGKRCRSIVMEPSEDEAIDRAGIASIFHDGYVAGISRIVAPPPEKLPWKRTHPGRWELGQFALMKKADGTFHCFWPGGEVTGGKDEISAAVRQNWDKGH